MDKKITCTDCNRKFAGASGLESHQRSLLDIDELHPILENKGYKLIDENTCINIKYKMKLSCIKNNHVNYKSVKSLSNCNACIFLKNGIELLEDIKQDGKYKVKCICESITFMSIKEMNKRTIYFCNGCYEKAIKNKCSQFNMIYNSIDIEKKTCNAKCSCGKNNIDLSINSILALPRYTCKCIPCKPKQEDTEEKKETVVKKKNIECDLCDKLFTSASTMYNHKREKHSHRNCSIMKCTLCENEFYSPNNTRNGIKINYLKCEECRELEKFYETTINNNNTFFYSKSQKYFITNGNVIRICNLYTCDNKEDKDGLCYVHRNNKIIECTSDKCNNIYIVNGKNQCERCREKNNKSKNKVRQKLVELKIELGGKCVDCNTNDLWKLEFDHINPSEKTKQITRMKPDDWKKEKDNIKLRCGNCHRIRNYHQQHETDSKTVSPQKSSSNSKKREIVKQIKLNINKCQVCNWTSDNLEYLSVVLDFDHLNPEEKYKNISRMYSENIDIILNEIKCCRCICRSCHQLHTSISLGGKMLSYMMSKEDIQKYKEMFNNVEKNKEYVDEIEKSIIKIKN